MRLINNKDQRTIISSQNADTISLWLVFLILMVAIGFAWWLY
jgi:hypothetical protein